MLHRLLTDPTRLSLAFHGFNAFDSAMRVPTLNDADLSWPW
jgi:hypothetical protein